MSYWNDVYIRQEQRNDCCRAAEMRRLVAEARAGQPARRPIYAQPMAAIGRRLVHWGRRLEAQYGTVESTARMTARVA